MCADFSSTLLARNVERLAGRNPVAASAVTAPGAVQDFSVGVASTGDPVLVHRGRPLDSMRDPKGSAARTAAGIGDRRVVIAGLGTGYLAEALLARGVHIAALIVERAALRAVLAVRDLTDLIERVPILVAEDAIADTTLSALRASSDGLVQHGAAVAASEPLHAFVSAWRGAAPAGRRPRVLVVGPIVGGSLELARSTARAVAAAGVEMVFFDASPFAAPFEQLGQLAHAGPARAALQATLVDVARQAVIEIARTWRPDLLLALAQAPLEPASLQELRTLGVPTAFWFVENQRVLTYWRDVAPWYDWFFAIQPGRGLERLAEAGAPRPRYLPVGCDPEVHRPVVLTSDERSRYAADVSFAGAAYVNRRRVFAALTDYHLRLWGPDWSRDRVLAPRAAPGGRFDLDEMLRIFAGSRINLNLHSAEHVDGLDPEPDYVNPRTFELAACRAFQLVDRRTPLADLFAADEIATFDSVASLRQAVDYYLAHEPERDAMAARASARATSAHTIAERVRVILREALPAPLLAAATPGARPPSVSDAVEELTRQSAVLTREEALVRIVGALAPSGTAA